MTYALVVWGSCGKCLFDELERIHIRAAKIIYGMAWCTPSDEVLVNCNWFTIKRSYEFRLLSPELVKQLFTKYNSNYNLRRKLTFTQPKPNTEFLRKSTCYKAITLWNSVDNDIRAISSKSMFKNKIKRNFLYGK